MARLKLSVLAGILIVLSSVNCYADALYKFHGAPLFDGKFGPVANLQRAMIAGLKACGKNVASNVDGRFGPATRYGLGLLSKCPEIAPKLAGDAEAAAGSLTTAFWMALLPEMSPPSLDQRAQTIMLTYEATDYTEMEWNFCQSNPLYDPNRGNKLCYSNDPRSYLTWGPNGATAGGGHEVQLILQALDKADPGYIDSSFGGEASAIRRMFEMRDRDQDRSLETYLCSVWASPGRRAAWKSGFRTLGAIPAARETFDRLYKSTSLDGGKVASFYYAYAANHLVPTEADYGFFKDRAAHTSVDYDEIKKAIGDQLRRAPDSKPWQVRQAIARNVRPNNQRMDRLGRDVAFYIDLGERLLNAEEISAWKARGTVWASSAGLLDEQQAPGFKPEAPIDTSLANPSSLTFAERRACPQAVLDTRQPG
ncbi:hypothetical protein [Rhizobium lusitanum]|uniref:Peptidoglycan binding domain-containing protein n=1 Tax=Rhizobium lusitanum TaxID=293958 RepID=A0A7X0ITG3_9HYPH|nr:hypothetical protein [Rhizobium lusitanum]MBB6486855.1 hypothetical protein [Rhizobium lusitanum]